MTVVLGGETHLPYRVAVSSNRNFFDIDDVILTFYYGSDNILSDEKFIDSYPKYQYENPYFELFFGYRDVNNEHQYYLIERVDENIVSQKYACRYEYLETTDAEIGAHRYNVHFNYSEEIKVPKEVFQKDFGVISFSLWTITPDNGDSFKNKQPIEVASIWFYYIKTGEQIELYVR